MWEAGGGGSKQPLVVGESTRVARREEEFRLINEGFEGNDRFRGIEVLSRLVSVRGAIDIAVFCGIIAAETVKTNENTERTVAMIFRMKDSYQIWKHTWNFQYYEKSSMRDNPSEMSMCDIRPKPRLDS